MIRVNGELRGVSTMISALSQIPSLLQQGGIRAMTESLELVSATTRREFLSGPYPTHLEPRTGRLRASLRRGDRDNIFRVAAQGSQITGEFGTSVVYARIHEVGGVITPKHGQYLAIPTGFAKTSGGVLKTAYNRPLRQIPNTFLLRTRGGLMLWERLSGRGGGRRRLSEVARPLFRLVRRVVIPARPYLAPSAQQSEAGIAGIFTAMVQRLIDRANDTLRRIGR